MKKVVEIIVKILAVILFGFIVVMAVYRFTFNTITDKKPLIIVKVINKIESNYFYEITTYDNLLFAAYSDTLKISATVIKFRGLSAIGIKNFSKINVVSGQQITKRLNKTFYLLKYLLFIKDIENIKTTILPSLNKEYHIYLSDGELKIKVI